MPEKLERCVEEVSKDPDVKEPFAVCTEAIKEAKKKLANIHNPEADDKKRKPKKKSRLHSILSTQLEGKLNDLKLNVLKMHAQRLLSATLSTEDEIMLTDVLKGLQSDDVEDQREKLMVQLLLRQDIEDRKDENPNSEILKQELESKDQQLKFMIEDVLRMDKKVKGEIPITSNFMGKLTAKLLSAFEESEHPRDDSGEFTKGSGGEVSKKDDKKSEKQRQKESRELSSILSKSNTINKEADVKIDKNNDLVVAGKITQKEESERNEKIETDRERRLQPLEKRGDKIAGRDTESEDTSKKSQSRKNKKDLHQKATDIYENDMNNEDREELLVSELGFGEDEASVAAGDDFTFSDLLPEEQSKLTDILTKQRSAKHKRRTGKLRTGSLVDDFRTANNDRYVSYFLLNASVNLKEWGVTADSIPMHIATFKNMPFVVTKKKFFAKSDYGEITDHPSTEHFARLGISRRPEKNDMMQQAAFQEEFRVGNIEEIIPTKSGDYLAFIKIKPEFANYEMPPLVSPAIFQLNPMEPPSRITQWVGMHLAGLDESPAYGNSAVYRGSCNGDKGTCLTQLSAKMPQLHAYLPPCAMKKIFNARLKVALMKIAAMQSSDHPQIVRLNVLKKKKKDRE